jgi:hypothetical protein
LSIWLLLVEGVVVVGNLTPLLVVVGRVDLELEHLMRSYQAQVI